MRTAGRVTEQLGCESLRAWGLFHLSEQIGEFRQQSSDKLK